ncbi:MAG: NADH-quinone oxidoreductase subunit N [Nitrososphaerota archaeon]|nr:NADH-quinone oxidoreductase subunit N [Nitrososphaerota archaeon]
MLILIATLAVPAVLVPMLMVLGKRHPSIAAGATVASLVVALYELPFLFWNAPTGLWYYPQGLLSFDGVSFIFSATILIVSLMVTVSSYGMMKENANSPIYYSLILFTTLGMVLVSSSSDLLMLLVSWELMTVPSFVLVAFRRKDTKSSEAAMKYFLAAALSAALILFGISIAYGLAGSTSFQAVAHAFAVAGPAEFPVVLLASALLASGFAVKMAIAPFHFWLPDALEGSYPQIAALLGAGSKKAGFAAALRIFVVLLLIAKFSTAALNWQIALAVVSAVTITWGNVAALTQKSMSRMLAYSSIAQAGYMMIGLAVQGTAGAAFGLIGLLLHVLFHGVMKGSAFISTANTGDSVEGLAGLYRRAPATALGLTISLFALAGLPPLNGFWSKLYLFIAAVQASMPWLAAVALANSALALGYYSYLVKKMYFDEPTQERRPERPEVLAVLLFSSVFIVATGLYPTPIINTIVSVLSHF